MKSGLLLGRPLVEQKVVWLATADGTVVRLDLETAKLLGSLHTRRIPTSGVVRVGDRLVVCTADGALLEVGR